MVITDRDRAFLTRAVDLAEAAVRAGDEPFGSVLVSPAGEILMEDHNRVGGGDRTQHPEVAIARWAAVNLTPEVRAQSVVYTSGEHCPMCAAAHGWVGLGRIVYASSSAQLTEWARELGLSSSPVAALPISSVVPGAEVDGPDAELAERVRALHAQRSVSTSVASAPSLDDRESRPQAHAGAPSLDDRESRRPCVPTGTELAVAMPISSLAAWTGWRRHPRSGPGAPGGAPRRARRACSPDAACGSRRQRRGTSSPSSR